MHSAFIAAARFGCKCFCPKEVLTFATVPGVAAVAGAARAGLFALVTAHL